MDFKKENIVDDQTINALLDGKQEEESIDSDSDEEIEEAKNTDLDEEDDQEEIKVEQKLVEEIQPKKEQPKNSIDWDSEENPYKQKADNLETRYSDSSREAQLILQREKGLKERLEKLNSAEVTEDDIKVEYPNIDLEFESEATKIILKDQVRARRERQKEKVELERSSATTQFKTQMELIKKDVPEIATNEEAFYKFVMEKDPQGTIKDLSILVSHFKDVVLSKKEIKNISKNPTLLKNNGGRNLNTAENKIDINQLAKLRQNNPSEYRKLVLSGAIKDSDVDF